jgi:benzodiazapine receptor
MIIPVTVATIAALCVAALGATITDLGPWYQALAKPDWNPPDVVFPMGWTVIYALITVAGITAWRAAPTSAAAEWVIGLFALNGFLNISWSLIFFRLQRPDWAFFEVLLLWISILAMILYCGRFSRKALSCMGQLCRQSQLGRRPAQWPVRLRARRAARP